MITYVTLVAHVLAWVVFVVFVFLPAYQSSSGSSSTLIQVNGFRILALLFLPPLLTAAGILAARETATGGRFTAPLLILALLLVGVAEYFFLFGSRGWPNLPALLALLAAGGLFAARRLDANAARATLWIAAVSMLLFCAGGIWSVGLLYVPSALALLAAAAMSPAIPSRRSASRAASQAL